MEIQTTININKVVMEELNSASIKLCMTRSHIIRLLLKQFLNDDKIIKIFNSPIQYQSRDCKKNWSKFHLTLREDEYECCLDLRKVYKMSLSSIIALSVKKYLKKIIEIFSNNILKNTRDTYLYHNYFFSFYNTNGITYIRISWGITNFKKLITDNYQNII